MEVDGAAAFERLKTLEGTWVAPGPEAAVLNFQTLLAGGGNDLPYTLFLPTYAAAAWHHKRLSGDLQADLARTLREVEQFALGEYNAALAAGDSLDAAHERGIAESLSRYTSLPVEWILKANLRIDPWPVPPAVAQRPAQGHRALRCADYRLRRGSGSQRCGL